MGARVFVTGGGGSIGTELVRQLIAAGDDVTVFELSEFNLYQVEQVVGRRAKMLLGDVRHKYPMLAAMKDAKPEVVFHAAALKHVPILEHPHNLIEAVRTNVLGTTNVLECAAEVDARVALISTDKAVSPLSIMGRTKALAEVAALSFKGLATIVRFGNVIGSSGSVVPLFHKQIAAGGPVTITHPDMVRFFMSIREAVSLVRDAEEMTRRNGKPGAYVFDMGEPRRILDVAKEMIRLFGSSQDIDIKVIGLRPGEKLYEDLTWPDEALRPTEQPKIRLISPPHRAISASELPALIDHLRAACEERNAAAVRIAMQLIDRDLVHDLHC
jgi:FlaA1/EpsC-like NDP-sugar epimerase